MTPKEFTFWFLGAMQVGSLEELNRTQTASVKRCLSDVVYEKNSNDDFPAWLSGYLDVMQPDAIDVPTLRKINQKLNACVDKFNSGFHPMDAGYQNFGGAIAKC